jgi:phospholipid/cholesterol/gamma-HCH transport system substrate-binding protein
MKKQGLIAGIFVVSALLLFSVGLFLIGDSHQAFTHHLTFYTELFNVNGLVPGLRVRVGGYVAGQVQGIQIPHRPSEKFRMKLQIDAKLRNLIREDSIVTVETDGVVGDKFLLIHDGTDQSREAVVGATLRGKEPIEISAVIAKVSTVIDQASGVMGDVQAKINVALNTATRTIDNADGLITLARSGNGPVGVMLNDKQTAAQLKQAVANAEQASAHLNQISLQAGQIVTDAQSRQFPAKVDAAIANAQHAVRQLDQASQQVNTTLNGALGPDRSGEDAAENIRESLSNVNLVTANMADDTEALKHEFFFKGFFKKRGFYSLQELTPSQYRANSYFQRASNHRLWLEGAEAFTTNSKGSEVLSATGERQIDRFIGNEKNVIMDEPMVIEGYSEQPVAAEQITISTSRSLLAAQYLEKHFRLKSQDIGMISLMATPPPSSARASWDGACIVLLARGK